MNRISVANFQVLDRLQNYRMFNVRTIVKPLKYLSQYNSLFFDPPCMPIFDLSTFIEHLTVGAFN